MVSYPDGNISFRSSFLNVAIWKMESSGIRFLWGWQHPDVSAETRVATITTTWNLGWQHLQQLG